MANQASSNVGLNGMTPAEIMELLGMSEEAGCLGNMSIEFQRDGIDRVSANRIESSAVNKVRDDYLDVFSSVHSKRYSVGSTGNEQMNNSISERTTVDVHGAYLKPAENYSLS